MQRRDLSQAALVTHRNNGILQARINFGLCSLAGRLDIADDSLNVTV